MRTLLAALLLAALPAFAFPFILKDPVAVSVTTSATSLASGVGYTFVEVCNRDTAATLFVGFSTALTASTGRPVNPGACVAFAHLNQGQAVYGIAASGTITVIVTKAFET